MITATAPATVSAADFSALLSKGTPISVLDVRTPAEFSECHVEGAKLAPLDVLDPKKAANALKPEAGAPIYLLCKGGTRAAKAAEKFIAAGIPNVCVVTGGTDACVTAGLPVARGAKAGMPIEAQVRLFAGGLILAFWLLARFVHPGFTYLVLFMAAGLIFSAVSGICGMGILLGKAPWNQSKDADSCRVC